MTINYNVKECDKNGIDSVLVQKVIVSARRDNFYLNIYSNITEFFACGVSATCIFNEKRFKESQKAYILSAVVLLFVNTTFLAFGPLKSSFKLSRADKIVSDRLYDASYPPRFML